MNLKIIMLNKRSQTRQSTCCKIPFVANFFKCKLIYVTKSGSVLALEWSGVVREEWLARSEKGVRKPGENDGLFIILILVMASWVCICVRRYQISFNMQVFVCQVHFIRENKAATAIDTNTWDRHKHSRSCSVQTDTVQFSSLAQSCPAHCNHMDHTRLPCPSPTSRACSNSCLLSQWCHPTISSSAVTFSSCLQSFPASGSFPVSPFFALGGQSIGVSASASVLPMNIQNWFPLGCTGLISLQSNTTGRF